MIKGGCPSTKTKTPGVHSSPRRFFLSLSLLGRSFKVEYVALAFIQRRPQLVTEVVFFFLDSICLDLSQVVSLSV